MIRRAFLLTVGLVGGFSPLVAASVPIAPPDLTFAEVDGVVAVEAEHFIQQDLTLTRAFHIVSTVADPGVQPDPDPAHAGDASGRGYVEVLPDTRATADDPLTPGINVASTPGQHAVLSYRVRFTRAGRYYFWARTYSTGDEDNSLHVGLDGQWPQSGRSWQTVRKHGWHWDSRRRTSRTPVGEMFSLYLDVPSAGEHIVQISMEEDGLELDKWILARGVAFEPEGDGPTPVVVQGMLPPPFPAPSRGSAGSRPGSEANLPFPEHWGPPPAAQTRDLRPLPAGFGQGSSTLARWIEEMIAADNARDAAGTLLDPSQFALPDSGFRLIDDKWAAWDTAESDSASADATVPVSGGRYHVTLHASGDPADSARTTFEILIAGRSLGTFTPPAAVGDGFAEGPAFNRLWRQIEINSGETVTVRASRAPNRDDSAPSGRWSRLVFTPVDYDPSQLGTSPYPAGLSQAGYQRSNARGASANVFVRAPDGEGRVTLHGELRQWHAITLDLDGPFAHEDDLAPNPFTDYAFEVTFTHTSGQPSYTVPGYFAADGRAAESSATAGRIWRAHLSPDAVGEWSYTVSFRRGPHAATYHGGTPLAPFDGKSGTFRIDPGNKATPDFRARGRLVYTGERYRRFAGDGTRFLKVGPDAPETFLAYTGFDNTTARRTEAPLKSWTAHIPDWRDGDPTWRDGRGRGIVGALNYLAGKGLTTISFLTYNAGGDGDNVWPFVDRDDPLHYDVSKLAQWEIVFAHAQARGLHLNFKLQETENDDRRTGSRGTLAAVPTALDGGETGPARRLYLRELVARFGHHLALTWNLGEENTQNTEEQLAMLNYLAAIDPYRHHRTLHTYPDQQDSVYTPLLGPRSKLTGVSLQNPWNEVHARTAHWLGASRAAGQTWVVANDEQNPAHLGVPPDPGYAGFDGRAIVSPGAEGVSYDLHDIRRQVLWGNLMAGGAGVEYYFGYSLPQNDLLCEDFRSRDRSWDFCRIALTLFQHLPVELTRLQPADTRVRTSDDARVAWCLAAPDAAYVIYLPDGGDAHLNLTEETGAFVVTWVDPRTGESHVTAIAAVTAGGEVELGPPPTHADDDWAIVLLRE